MVKIIGLGEYAVSDEKCDSIKTYALASCVGLVVYNRASKVVGMVHIVLPERQENDVLKRTEGFFAETAVPLLFGAVFGGYPDKKIPYEVSLYGGSNSKNKNDLFNVGARNLKRVEKILKENHIKYDKKNTGGCLSRTIEAHAEDGSISIHTQEMKI